MGVDYAQNLSLPNFGQEQPADIYYYSPLTVNVFGCTNLTQTPTTMTAYGYTEAEATKGSNNVSSLLLKAIKDFGWLQGTTGKALTVVMDNCGGQNKNNNVLRLALYLVERKYFHRVEFAFYVRGHTKNDCDRLFNQLKIKYHKMNVYTMSQLVDCLNFCDNITFIETKSDSFFDYGNLLDKFYRSFQAGSIQKNHLFWVESSNPTKMFMKPSADSDTIISYEFKTSTTIADLYRTQQMQQLSPVSLQRPGIKPIKQVELYKNWRPFIPREYRDEICPKPSDEVINEVQNERNAKSRARAAKKRRERDGD